MPKRQIRDIDPQGRVRSFTTREAAKILGVSYTTIQRRFDAGELLGFVEGTHRRILREQLLNEKRLKMFDRLKKPRLSFTILESSKIVLLSYYHIRKLISDKRLHVWFQGEYRRIHRGSLVALLRDLELREDRITFFDGR